METPPVISREFRMELLALGARVVSDQLVAFSAGKKLATKTLEDKCLKFYARGSGRIWYRYTGTPDEM